MIKQYIHVIMYLNIGEEVFEYGARRAKLRRIVNCCQKYSYCLIGRYLHVLFRELSVRILDVYWTFNLNCVGVSSSKRFLLEEALQSIF